jgi:aminoglycoside phosphotransferase (APT) family kinase protein
LRRYRVRLRQGEPVTLIAKTMPRKERRVMHHLGQQGHAHTPFAYTDDLETNGPVWTCLQDLGNAQVGIPVAEDVAPPSARFDRQVADALAAIHVRNLGQREQLSWLPCADAAYVTDFLAKDVWRGNWEDALAANAAFAAEFARYTPQLERAAGQLAQTFAALWQEGDSLTLTHGEVHGEHVMIHQNRPYLIDWGWTYYGPFYLDLPAYFTPQTVHHYRRALAEQGVEIAESDFMERYHAIGRYVGFKYLCSGIWLWPPGPTAANGRRILLTIQWALTGTWPERAFAVSPAAWGKLLAGHERFVAGSSESGLSGF